MPHDRLPLVAGNWKMNMLTGTGADLASAVLRKLPQGADVEVLFCPPFTALAAVHAVINEVRPRRLLADGSPAANLGAQDLYPGVSGAFTGEISAPMLRDVGCRYVIVGHSERRHVLGEDDEVVASKLNAALTGGLVPILCVGELESERNAGAHFDVVARQLRTALGEAAEGKRALAAVIAYEPVWAIGTGRTATPQDAQEMHAFIRESLSTLLGSGQSARMRILYGGSVKPGNAAELMAQPDIDGALVGGASLEAAAFLGIVEGSTSHA